MTDLLSECDDLGIVLWVDGKTLRFRSPEGAIDAHMLERLRKHKDQLIDLLTGLAAQRDDIPSVDRTRGDLPLSFEQERLWILNQLNPDDPSYNVAGTVSGSGALDPCLLRDAIEEVIDRHEVLRTAFHNVNGGPVQIVRGSNAFRLELVDCSVLSEADWAAAKGAIIRKEVARPFALSSGLLVRAILFSRTASRHTLLFVVHHIVCDEWSMGNMLTEIQRSYQDMLGGWPLMLAKLPIQFADFAVWQRTKVRQAAWQQSLAAHVECLQQMPHELQLPLRSHCESSTRFHRADFVKAELSTALLKRLIALGDGLKCTPFVTLVTLFELLLYHYSGQERFLFGSPMANRPHEQTFDLIGCFVNTIIIPADLSGNPTFAQLLRRNRSTVIDLLEHPDLPFGQLVEWVAPSRKPGESPLLQVMLVYQSSRPASLQLGPFTASEFTSERVAVAWPLSLWIRSTGASMELRWEFDPDRLDRDVIVGMSQHFMALIDRCVAAVDDPISLLPKPSQVLHDWNDTALAYPKDQCLHDLFEQQARKSPDAVAVAFEDQHLTYDQLSRRSNQLAHHLRSLGVGPDQVVGVRVGRSLEMVVGLLGILKSGGAYLPLEPHLPPDRLQFMLRDAGTNIVLTQKLLPSRLTKDQIQVVQLDDFCRDRIAAPLQRAPETGVLPQNLAYVLYTSGSTGTPKGVALQHQSAVAFVTWATSAFTSTELSAVLASTSFGFDLSIFEMFAPLCSGGTVVVVPNAITTDELVRKLRVTCISTVPSVAATLIEQRRVPKSVQAMALAGEPLHQTLVDEIYQQVPLTRVVDLYGPTETTTYSTMAHRRPKMPATIGRPIANTQVYLLDKRFNPVPVGTQGELYIGGAGLARGYLNRPDLTAECFVPNAFAAIYGARLYRTGDLARHRKNGDIEFLGRADQQIKLHGNRVELGEIEDIVVNVAGIRQTTVIVREDVPGQKRLVAYYVADATHASSLTYLREHVAARLPGYMVPSQFVRIDALPKLPNGKTDRLALAGRPNVNPIAVACSTAFSDLERKIADLWREALKRDDVGLNDNFFDAGGTSLLMLQIHTKLQVLFPQVKVIDLFTYPTVRSLAELLSGSTATPAVADLALKRGALRRQRLQSAPNA
jgi:surfactin family lipopeptide synthetase A